MKRQRLLDPKQTSETLAKPVRTLANWRSKRYGPPFIRVGGSIRYREEDVLAFLESGRVDTVKVSQ